MKIKVKKWLPLILLVLITSIIVYSPTLFNGKGFYWYNDQQFQYNVFYQEWNNIIQEIKRTHTLSIYSWSTFLGTDYFVSKLFTCVGDFIATPFFILYKWNVNYDLLLCVETIICLIISVITMKLFLEKFGIKSELIVNCISIVYTFSGFIMVFSGSYMFHRFYCLLPLLFYYCEKYIQNKKLFGFSIIVALLLLQNYELMFSASLFLIIYFIFSKKLKGDDKLPIILKESLPLIGSYMVGILLVGFAIIPLLLFIKSGPRVGTFSFDSLFWSLKENLLFISNYFYPPSDMNSNHLGFLFFSNRYSGFAYSFFTSPLIIIALLNLKQCSKRERIIITLTELITVFLLVFRPFNMIMHGFSEPSFRWSFVLLFLNCLLSAYMFDKYDLKSSKIAAILFVLIVCIIFFITMYQDDKLNTEYLLSILIYCISILLIIIFSFIPNKYKNFLLIFVMIENILCYAYSVRSAWKQYEDNAPNKFNGEYIEYFINKDDDKMYRMYFKPEEIYPYSSLCLNDAMEYNYMSTTSYDSAYSWVLSDFLIKNDCYDWIININDPELLKMLGVKYIGVYEDTSIIDKLDVTHEYDLDNIKMYKINDYNHIGHTYTSFVKESNFKKDMDWNNTLIVSDDIFDALNQYNKLPKAQLIVEEYNRQYLKGTLDTKGDSILFMSIPYSTGWNVVDQNGNKLSTLNVQGGFLGIEVNENIKELSFYYRTPGLKFGLILSCFGFIMTIGLLLYDKKYENKTQI